MKYKTELRKADRTVGFNCNILIQLTPKVVFQAFAFADQILPGSGTFDLSVGPFSLSKV